MGWLLVLAFLAQPPQSAREAGPAVPFEDPGACPFEGCIYRQWTATAKVPVHRERRADSPIVFTVQPKERVTAITGTVITVKSGRVQFREPTTLAAQPPIHIEPGETLYLLTYEGEGFFKVWFKGVRYDDVDSGSFDNGACEIQPARCTGRIVEPSVTEWWVQVRDRRGRVGWINEPGKFAGKDALGAR